jgi:rhodanese-related sulfurtransferase
MQKMILFCFAVLGMALLSHAQGTDTAYVAKLKSLYKGTVPLMEPAKLAHAMGSEHPPLILDTRSAKEFEVSHLRGAHFVNYEGFSKKDVAGFYHSRPVVVYCTVGYRSERIGEQLKKLGFKNVTNLYGGIFEWVNQGHEVVDSEGKPTQKVHAYSEDWGKWLLKGQKVYE